MNNLRLMSPNRKITRYPRRRNKRKMKSKTGFYDVIGCLMSVCKLRLWIFWLFVFGICIILTCLWYTMQEKVSYPVLIRDYQKVKTTDAQRRNTTLTSVIQRNVTHVIPRKSNEHKLALFVPFRNCLTELKTFAPYIHNFLNNQGVSHRIYVMNQVDEYRFNRASLINVGYREMDDSCDYLAIHDVDLLPLNRNLSYRYPEKGPFHLTTYRLHPYVNYKDYFGGILLMTNGQFEKVNGMSNLFWGWGGEDDELFKRVKKSNLTIVRPTGINTNRHSFRHIHNLGGRPRDKENYFNQAQMKRQVQPNSGFHNVQYEIESVKEESIGGAPVTFINVLLKCNVKVTPFCVQKSKNETAAT